MRRLFCFVFTLIVFAVQAQDIQPDRPDQSDGAAILKKKSFQLETTVNYTRLDSTGNAFISSTLFRYGVTKKLELRLLVEQGKNRDVFMDQTAESQYPLAWSSKFSILEETGTRPGISVAGYLQLPFTNGKQPDRWSSALLLIAEKEWKPFTVTVNAGYKQEAFEKEVEFQATTDIKFEINDQLQLFAEYFGQFGKSLPFSNMDTGLLYQINKHWMLYAAAGTSIHHAPSNYFVSTGFAFHI